MVWFNAIIKFKIQIKLSKNPDLKETVCGKFLSQNGFLFNKNTTYDK